MLTMGEQNPLPTLENVISNDGSRGGGLGVQVPWSQIPSSQSVSKQQAPTGRQTGAFGSAAQQDSLSWQHASPQAAPEGQQYWPFSTQTPLQRPSTEQY